VIGELGRRFLVLDRLRQADATAPALRDLLAGFGLDTAGLDAFLDGLELAGLAWGWPAAGHRAYAITGAGRAEWERLIDVLAAGRTAGNAACTPSIV
jgi:hypothetical protein